MIEEKQQESDEMEALSHVAQSQLELRDITHSYDCGKSFIFKDFNYKFSRGKLYAFMGASGSGKSTLLHIASGLLKPSDSGQVYLGDNPIGSNCGQKNSFIFSDHYLIAELTCLENLKLCCEDTTKLIALAKQLGVESILNQYPDKISSGQLQRVSAVRAFSLAKDVLFADEPTSHLDKDNSKSFIELIAKKVKDENLIFLCVTHDNTLEPYFDEVVSL